MAKQKDLANYDLSALHSAVSAGEPLNVEVINVFQNNYGLEVRDGYGQMENNLLVGVMKGMEARIGSMANRHPATVRRSLTTLASCVCWRSRRYRSPYRHTGFIHGIL
ncbi:acetyl-CoA synthetase [Planococcus antarcticus DSM 14505]|uniref:Acetyl-CoA synthetase n=1 Tax=Planococcus antarcticus DSM 14505 TaxID=1185653 RepID=A0AA87IKZ1_9BACL|nr:acetyl-CoA synthetase [Planococcus antarcticus DSM 14505]